MYQKADKAEIQQHLSDRFGLPEEQLESLLPDFFRAISGHQTVLEQSLKDQDADALCKAAHKYKGALANLGLAQAADLALQIELATKAGQVNKEYVKISAAIREIVEPLF